MKLSILIASLGDRNVQLDKLITELDRQLTEAGEDQNTQIIHFQDMGEKTIGTKRNELLEAAEGEYLCFFDDDDWPRENYIASLFDGMSNSPDCVSLCGIMKTDGKNPEKFEHSIMYEEYRTNEKAVYPEVKYERFPNHLNCIKSSIAKQFKFPEKNHGEDTDWATQIHESGLLTHEAYSDQVIYYYNYSTKK